MLLNPCYAHHWEGGDTQTHWVRKGLYWWIECGSTQLGKGEVLTEPHLVRKGCIGGLRVVDQFVRRAQLGEHV